MLDEAASSESSDAIARKKELLLQRLQQRRSTKQAKSGTDQAKLREEELTDLLNRASEQAESGIVDDETVRSLDFKSVSVEAVPASAREGCGWSAKRIQNMLELLRKASVGASSEGPQKSAFSFSVLKKKPTSNSAQTESPKRVQLSSSPEQSSVIPSILSDNAISLSDLVDETRVVTGKDGNDVKLKDIKNCNLCFAFRASTVHIQGLSDSRLVFLPVETSILMNDCVQSQIFAVAQQLRIHTSNELRLHIAVRAAVIIEACTNIRLAPYRVTFNGEPVDAPPGDGWKHPRDFDWLAEGQSPNWFIAPEVEWETAVIKSTSIM